MSYTTKLLIELVVLALQINKKDPKRPVSGFVYVFMDHFGSYINMAPEDRESLTILFMKWNKGCDLGEFKQFLEGPFCFPANGLDKLIRIEIDPFILADALKLKCGQTRIGEIRFLIEIAMDLIRKLSRLKEPIPLRIEDLCTYKFYNFEHLMVCASKTALATVAKQEHF